MQIIDMKTFIGEKIDMSQVWESSGKRWPITRIKVRPMLVTQVKSVKVDGYPAIQVGVGSRPSRTVTKPLLSHLKPALSKPPQTQTLPRHLTEIRLENDSSTYTVGQTIAVGDIISAGNIVSASGISKGRGFAGVMKRWGFKGGPKTHGQSDRARAPGAIGQGTSPGRVHKGKKMAGRFGQDRVSIPHLRVLKIDPHAEELWLSGSLPGKKGSLISLTFQSSGKFSGLINDPPPSTDTSAPPSKSPDQSLTSVDSEK